MYASEVCVRWKRWISEARPRDKNVWWCYMLPEIPYRTYVYSFSWEQSFEKILVTAKFQDYKIRCTYRYHKRGTRAGCVKSMLWANFNSILENANRAAFVGINNVDYHEVCWLMETSVGPRGLGNDNKSWPTPKLLWAPINWRRHRII